MFPHLREMIQNAKQSRLDQNHLNPFDSTTVWNKSMQRNLRHESQYEH